MRDKGASALAAILKDTQITELRCAAPLSAPIDTPQHPPLLPCSQSEQQRPRPRGRRRSRREPRGQLDAAIAGVGHRRSKQPPSVCLSVSPIDTIPPSLGSLASNRLCGLDKHGDGIYTAEGITKLCDALKGSAVTSLKCAASLECSHLCQRPLTLLLCPWQLGRQPVLWRLQG